MYSILLRITIVVFTNLILLNKDQCCCNSLRAIYLLIMIMIMVMIMIMNLCHYEKKVNLPLRAVSKQSRSVGIISKK